MSDPTEPENIEFHQFSGVTAWLSMITLAICVGLVIVCIIWKLPEPLVYQGDELVGISFKGNTGGLLPVSGEEYFLSMTGHVFYQPSRRVSFQINGDALEDEKCCYDMYGAEYELIKRSTSSLGAISIAGYHYLGKENPMVLGKLKRIALENDIRFQTQHERHIPKTPNYQPILDQGWERLALYFKSGRIVESNWEGENFHMVKNALMDVALRHQFPQQGEAMGRAEEKALHDIFKIPSNIIEGQLDREFTCINLKSWPTIKKMKDGIFYWGCRQRKS